MNSQTIINDIRARRIFNSRGEETIEVEVKTLGGFGRAAAPAGKSKGIHEVVAFPEDSVKKAVERVYSIIKPKIVGLDANNQELVDKTLHEVDGTSNFSFIGGNTAYAVSLAVAEAASSTLKQPLFSSLKCFKETFLPLPLGNVVGGGKHAGKGAPDIQEFLVLPVGAKTFFEAYHANIKVYRKIGEFLEKNVPVFTGGRGDEGAWAPPLKNEKALEVVFEATREVGSETGVEVRVGLDVASSSLWDSKLKCYNYVGEGKRRSKDEQIEYVLELIDRFNLVYVEDPLHEDDFEGFAELTRKAKNCLICGDDIFVTNKDRLKIGVNFKAANSLIIKPNQVGTLTDTLETVKLAKSAGYIPVLSHRSGETVDTHLAHLSIAFSCPIIKTGVVGGERTAKLNELIRIEEMFKDEFSIAKLSI
ncbi:MAG: phosphopyruvate hydratase [Candidatus Bathyarchaeota archaeon]